MRFPALLFMVCGIASSAVAKDASYPADAIFDAFHEGCGLIPNQSSTSARLVDHGWRKVERAEQSGALAEFVEFSIEASEPAMEASGATMAELEAFEKVVSGETVYIILDEVRTDEARISGCQLYDFGESRAIPSETAAQWLGRSPDAVIDTPELLKAEWNPGIYPEHDSFQLFFVPVDSPVAAALPFNGLALMSDTVGAE